MFIIHASSRVTAYPKNTHVGVLPLTTERVITIIILLQYFLLSKVSLAMDISGVIKRRSVPGILIYSMAGGLLYANEESIVLIPELRINVKNKSRALDEIRKLCEEVKQSVEKEDNENCNLNSVVLRDREGYSYYMRAFYLGGAGTGISEGQILILIEKIVLRHEPDFETAQSRLGPTNKVQRGRPAPQKK